MPEIKHGNASSVLPKRPDMTIHILWCHHDSRVIHLCLRANDQFELFKQCNFLSLFQHSFLVANKRVLDLFQVVNVGPTVNPK